jgi:Calx-beta domain
MTQPTLLIKDFSVTEGQEAQFIIGSSEKITGSNSIKLNIASGSAQGSDYNLAGAQISDDGVNFRPFVNGSEATIPIGKDCVYIKVPIVDDNVVEHDRFADTEKFTLTATPVNGLDGGPVVETASIIDNDIQRISVVSNGDKTEGDYASWTVSVDQETTGRWGWAKYELIDGTTQRSVDYDPGTLEFSTNGGSSWAKLFEGSEFGYAFKPGENSIQVRVKTTGDGAPEGTEALTLKVTPNTQGLEHLAPDVVQATVNIKDAPAANLPSLLIKDFSVTEGQEGQFIIGATSVLNGPNKLKLTIGDGSATAPDYTNLQVSTDGINFTPFTNGNEYSIAPGKDCIYVKFLAVDDNTVEHDRFTDVEKFTITAVPVSGFSGGQVVETAAIVDNDIQRISVVSNGDKTEGDYASWTVSVDKETTGRWGWAKYELVDGTTQRSVDYDPGTLEFSIDGTNWSKLFEGSDFGYAFKPGEKSIQVRVKTNGDGAIENTESLVLKVTPNTQGLEHLAPDVVQATVNIKDKTVPVKVGSVGDSKAPEGEYEQFKVTLTGTSDQPTKVDLTVTGDTATAGTDFDTKLETSFDGGKTWTPVNGSSVDVPAGTKDFLVRNKANNDNSVEPNETFKLTAGANGGSATGTGTIEDKTVPVKVGSVSDAKAPEGEYEQFKVTLTGQSNVPTKVELTLSGDSATLGTDLDNKLETSFDGGKTWVPVNGNSVDVAPGSTEFLVRTKATIDNVFEGIETFKLTANANGGSATGTGSIEDRTGAPKITSVSSPTAVEGQKEVFDIKLSNSSTTPTDVNLSLTGDSADPTKDLQGNLEVSFDGGKTWSVINGANVTVPAGNTDFQVRTQTNDDTIFEGNETFKLTASANGSSATGVATIIDNDVKPVVKANLVGSNELQEGGDKGNYCIQLDQATDKDRFFTIQIDNGSAQRYDSNGSGQDFVWGGSYDISSTGKVFFGKVPNDNINGYNNRDAVGPSKGDATWDFSVYNSQGQINKGNTVTIKVAAGQTKSEQFSVQAWNEKVTVDQDYHNPNGLNSSNYKEGSENFSLKITDAGDAQVGTGKLDVTINDKSNYIFVSPIAIDLNGDGVKTVSIDAGVTFDLLNTGNAVNVGWLSGEDGFLAIDKNHNGTIDDRSELFGGSVGEGFAQLASFDSNGDGQVNSQDSLFGDLAIWQDANVNGKTEAGELKSLAAASIASLNVAYSQQSIADANGNILGEKSTALNSNGQALEMVDVYFRVGQ